MEVNIKFDVILRVEIEIEEEIDLIIRKTFDRDFPMSLPPTEGLIVWIESEMFVINRMHVFNSTNKIMAFTNKFKFDDTNKAKNFISTLKSLNFNEMILIKTKDL